MLSATRETIRKIRIRKDSKRTTTKINSFINYYCNYNMNTNKIYEGEN